MSQLKQVNFKVDLYINMLYYAVRLFCFINFFNCKIMNFPILSSLILLPVIGALFLFFTKDKNGNNLTAKYVALFTSTCKFFNLNLFMDFF